VQDVAGHRVERAERLVHQQDVRVLRQRTGEGHALAHTAGELVRPLLAEAAQPHDLQQLGRALLAFRLADPLQPQRQLDVAGDGQPGEERGLLEHQRDFPAADVQGAAADLVEPGDEREQRALAAAGGAQQADELALPHRQRDVVERQERVGARPVLLGDILEADDRVGTDVGVFQEAHAAVPFRDWGAFQAAASLTSG
jgi:hypothetical protein